MPFDFEVSDTIPATPQQIYDAWLHGESHSEMTGGDADISPTVGAPFEAWDGYINGRNVELVPGVRIVQTWRTTKFTDADEDSRITVTFKAAGNGTLVTVRHQNVPDGHTGYQNGGWQESYFDPMKRYFSKP
jgi:uncharacterized protein YndB with AHSA1/START domain